MTEWPKTWNEWKDGDSYSLTVLKDPRTNSTATVTGTLTRIDRNHLRCECGKPVEIKEQSFDQPRFVPNTYKGTFTQHLQSKLSLNKHQSNQQIPPMMPLLKSDASP